MSKFIFFLLLSIIPSFIYAQKDSLQCGTIESTDSQMVQLPWFGNNQYLDSLRLVYISQGYLNDSLIEQRSTNCSEFIETPLFIPLRFRFITATEGDPNLPNPRQLQLMMDR